MNFQHVCTLAVLLAAGASGLQAQDRITTARFQTGDSPERAAADFDDSSWRTIDITRTWDAQGVPAETQFGWYRMHFTPARRDFEGAPFAQYVILDLGPVDDVDETYLNGVLIGSTGRIPSATSGYSSAWSLPRRYLIPAGHKALKWDEDNVVAVRCYSQSAPGGMFDSGMTLRAATLQDGAALGFAEKVEKGKPVCVVTLRNLFPSALSGKMDVKFTDMATGKVTESVAKKVNVKNGGTLDVALPYDRNVHTRVDVTFTEAKTGGQLHAGYTPKYILTPAAPESPRFNTVALYGVRPSSPVHYRFGVSGVRPMNFSSADLPAGLQLNAENGALSGRLTEPGNYTFTVTARNAKGEASQQFTLAVGDKIALTPPMGWNSWNCWGLSVTQDRVKESAQALIDKGLADYGYAYINVDDGWEAPVRDTDGTILVNGKFPDMKELGDWLHEQGLKFGIYSSPGDLTCGGYLGSLDHEKQDAESYNSWGIDYLKYDWCGYSRKHANEQDNGTVASYVRPYMLMEEHLRAQPRDIFYSLCQYGMADVWEWGRFVDANSWRTTGDIVDTWPSVVEIGFNSQAPLAPYAGPGGWNDPDMLVVGKVGWSDNLRDSRLTPDEQYSHISLWSLLASNMLIGCDLAQLDDFTINLLCNNEVNAVNQDILGKQASRVAQDGDIQVWARPLSDGSMAVGIFNLGDGMATVSLTEYLPALNLSGLHSIRDLWRQTDLDTANPSWMIPPHGVRFLKVRGN